MIHSPSFVAAAALLLAAPAHSFAPQGSAPPGNIVEVAAANGNFTTLVAALQATNLDVVLDGSANDTRWTVFAPTDAAFNLLPPGTVQALLNDLPTLTEILLYHVLEEGLLAANVLSSLTLDTVNGQRLDVSLQGGLPFVDQAQIVLTDIVTSNGVIHVIDAVLLPNLQTLVETAAGAPDAAYLSHLVELVPGLPQALDAGEFTIFAPNNAAFQAIPVGRLRELTSPSGLATLASVLGVHVVPGRLFASDVVSATSLVSLQGKVLSVQVVGNQVFIDNARILLTDIETANGNIHFIDRVLVP